MVPNTAFNESWLGVFFSPPQLLKGLTCLPEEDQGLDLPTLGSKETFKPQTHSLKVAVLPGASRGKNEAVKQH